MAGWVPQTPRSGEAEPRRDALAAAGLACALFALFLGKEGQPLGFLAALELTVLSGLARDLGGLRGRLTRLPALALVGVVLLALSPWLFAAAAWRPLPAAPLTTPPAPLVALAEPTGVPIAAASTSAAASTTPAPVSATPALAQSPAATPRPPTAAATAVLLPAEPITRLAMVAPAARGGTSRPDVPAEPAPQVPEPQALAQEAAKAQTPAPQAAATREPELAWIDIAEPPAVDKRDASAQPAGRTAPVDEGKLEIAYRVGDDGDDRSEKGLDAKKASDGDDRSEKGLDPKKASDEGKADGNGKANGRGQAVTTITAELGCHQAAKR